MDLTEKLGEAAQGDAAARHELVQLAYKDLRSLASAQMAGQRPDHTLTSTALVHELVMKLLGDQRLPPKNRSQFLAYASQAMRNLLIDHARSKGRQKRGGKQQVFSFEEALVAAQDQSEQLLHLNDVLEDLATAHPRKAQVVEMRYFGGLPLAEIAQALDVSLATVKRDWDVARTLLLHELKADEEP